MTTHELKIWPEYFEAVVDGRKTFEVHDNDRDFREGDLLRLREYVPPGWRENHGDFYTGRSITVRVTYLCVLPMTDGQVGMSIEKVTP